ncbi:MAG: ABC transporter permease [Betaproteobacteria bacterium TMED156]|nr:MAG: ABC transporter permease [Betaproteobacteria bacterium TMED156]|tara:strand:+ start:191 stop:970 length:780 start_codon:yes stop_codon:yes gene_type:complete
MVWFFFILFLLYFLLKSVEFYPWVLFDKKSIDLTFTFFSSFFPPEISKEFLLIILDATIQTVAIATAGLSLALLVAVPGALLICSRLSISYIDNSSNITVSATRYFFKIILIILRSVPELVWALILVRVLGLGPTAGVLAIALTYGGMLGKVYAEILESSDDRYQKNLSFNGSSSLQVLIYALIPQNFPELVSYSIYRWECAIRSTVVLGFVGAGGLGQQLENSMKMFSGNEVATILLTFILLVFVSDWISKWLRKKII